MKAPIEFYFDFSSPYGFVASERIEVLAAKHGRDVDWRPVLLGVVFKQTGGVPLTQAPIKGDYSKHDMARSARLYGIHGFRLPSTFPTPADPQAAPKRTRRVRTAPAGKTRARNLHLSDDVHDRLWLLARDRRTTVSAVANNLLDKALPRFEVKRQG